MDRKKSKQNNKSAAWVTGAVTLTMFVFGIWGYYRAKAKHVPAEGQEMASTTNPPSKSIVQTYKDAWVSANEKAVEIRHALEENEKLRNENANLRVTIENLRFEEKKKEAAELTAEVGKKNEQDAQTSETPEKRVARTLASVAYEPPANLLPSQLYTLGVTYFKAHEDEKAAVIFSFLTGLEDNPAYRTARNYVTAGVAWYRLGKYEVADHYFDLSLQQPDEAENMRYQAQARLWRSLIAQRAGKKTEAQYWLKDLLDHHPHSQEAEWINHSSSLGDSQTKSQEAERATASVE